jgi:hypothetical protein
MRNLLRLSVLGWIAFSAFAQPQTDPNGTRWNQIRNQPVFYVADYDSIAGAKTAAEAVIGAGGGAVLVLPLGITKLPSTLVFGIADSGLTVEGQGVPYNCVTGGVYSCAGGSVVTWAGSTNGTMFQLNGAYHTRFKNFILNGGGTAGRGIQYESTGSTTSQDDIENVEIRYVNGSPGYGVSVGETAVANVSEIRLNRVYSHENGTGFYQIGGQSFTWCEHCYFLSNATGLNFQDGFFSGTHMEFSGNSSWSVQIGSYTQGRIALADIDWEDATPFLFVPDATNSADFPMVTIDGLHALYDAGPSTPGTIFQWGVSGGAGGSFTVTNSRLASLYSNSVAVNLIQGGGGAGLYWYDIDNVWNVVGTYTITPYNFVYTTRSYQGQHTSNYLTVANLAAGQADSAAAIKAYNAAGSLDGSCDYTLYCQGAAFATPYSSPTAGMYGGNLALGSGAVLKGSSTSAFNGTANWGISGCGSNCVAAGNGSAGDGSSLVKLGGIGTSTIYNTASLPACSASGILLQRRAVSDATVNTPGSPYVGGGTYTIWVQCTYNSAGSVYAWLID